jgi:hypothetical protein
MTEYEILDLFRGYVEMEAVSFTIYLTLVSGYLVVGYLAGERLSALQTGIVTALFVTGATLQTWAISQYQLAIGELLSTKEEISPLTEFQSSVASSGGTYLFVVLMTLGMCASLYFMWSVRHPKKEEESMH